MGFGFPKWLWVVDMLVRIVREIIERLGDMNGGDDAPDVPTVRRAAARVLDPDAPDESISV